MIVLCIRKQSFNNPQVRYFRHLFFINLVIFGSSRYTGKVLPHTVIQYRNRHLQSPLLLYQQRYLTSLQQTDLKETSTCKLEVFISSKGVFLDHTTWLAFLTHSIATNGLRSMGVYKKPTDNTNVNILQHHYINYWFCTTYLSAF